MNVKITVDLTQFESISSTSGERLIGGFSASFTTIPGGAVADVGSNNCQGGNCAIGCGGGQNFQCNTAVGCGQL